jgi:hypothetical protein
MSISSSSWRPPPGAPGSCRALVHAARHRLSSFRGLGDVITWALARVGIHAHDACGCGRRQKWLNRVVPFRLSGKSSFDRRASVVAPVVLVNRLGTGVRGRLQLLAGKATPLMVELAELAEGARVTVQEEWTTGPRLRDQWSWMLEDGAGRVHTGHVVCAIEGPVELRLEAGPTPKMVLRQSHGDCVVELATA